MATRLREDYHWKALMGDVKKYVDSCHSCQMMKVSLIEQYGKNHSLLTPSRPWDQISMDFLTKLLLSTLYGQKFNALLVVEDMLAKQFHLILMTMAIKAERVARLYFDHIYWLHRLPRVIVSDRDTKFTDAFWWSVVDTDFMMSTTNHPQADRQMERLNRTILQILCTFVNQVSSNWAPTLPAVEFAINFVITRFTGKAPFEVINGYLPWSFPQIVFNQDNPALMDFIENRMLAQLSARPLHSPFMI